MAEPDWPFAPVTLKVTVVPTIGLPLLSLAVAFVQSVPLILDLDAPLEARSMEATLIH